MSASEMSVATADEPIALVTTPYHVLAVGLDTGTLRLVAEGKPEYYGISWFPESADLVLSHTGLDSRTLTTASAFRASQRGWVSLGERTLPTLLASPHQVLCAPDGRVICTNTGRNCISVLDPDSPHDVQEARASTPEWDRLGPNDPLGDHLNSLYLVDEALYVMAHGHANGSSIARFSYPTLDLMSTRDVTLRTGLHNLWITESGAILACHSSAGELVDVCTGNRVWTAPSHGPHYLRGLAATQDLIVVGACRVAHRSRRAASVTHLWVIERSTFRTKWGWDLGNWGAVQDVRIANRRDEAHHGQEFAGLEQLLSATSVASLPPGSLIRPTSVEPEVEEWSAFARLLFNGTFGHNGVFVASQESVSLFVERSSMPVPARTLTLEYAFRDADSTGHCAIVAYAGRGEDTHMQAFQLQTMGNGTCSLSERIHDGSEWRESRSLKNALPPRGRLSVGLHDESAEVRFNNVVVARVPIAGFVKTTNRMGVRVSGCAVQPPHISRA